MDNGGHLSPDAFYAFETLLKTINIIGLPKRSLEKQDKNQREKVI